MGLTWRKNATIDFHPWPPKVRLVSLRIITFRQKVPESSRYGLNLKLEITRSQLERQWGTSRQFLSFRKCPVCQSRKCTNSIPTNTKSSKFRQWEQCPNFWTSLRKTRAPLRFSLTSYPCAIKYKRNIWSSCPRRRTFWCEQTKTTCQYWNTNHSSTISWKHLKRSTTRQYTQKLTRQVRQSSPNLVTTIRGWWGVVSRLI